MDDSYGDKVGKLRQNLAFHLQQPTRDEGTIRNLKWQINQAEKRRASSLCRDLEKRGSEFSLSPEKVQLREYERLAYVIFTVYSEQDVTKCIREEARHHEILDKLEKIRQTIQTENNRLISTIRDEFAKTRKLLTEKFEQLHKDNIVAQTHLQQLLDGVDQLHQDLQVVNNNLRGIRLDVQKVAEYIDKSNQELAKLHDDLTTVQHQLVKLNDDMNRGMTAQQQMLGTVAEKLDDGFKTLHSDLQTAMLQEQTLHQELMQVEQQILQASNETNKTVLRTHQERLQAEARQTRIFIQNTQAIVNSQRNITDAIRSQTRVIYRSTDHLVTENRRTRVEITRLGRNMQRQVKQRGSGCTNICKVAEGVVESVETGLKKGWRVTKCVLSFGFACN
ncbi:hypothetical protein THIOM_000582 [Candidatus Thiomargarita nelsonii]|uniref:Uncharacterized protein n=1 Tax=Candidatus Thiomargarita nelsonii TaxID=1003181 RepID=A0A176S618_9GAMM|nr:hypothetical protein THIOM_000582 [Candidatus Thiomargarita nelsonii]